MTTTTTRTPRATRTTETKDPRDNPEQANKEIAAALAEAVPDFPIPELPPDDLVQLPGGFVKDGTLIRTAIVRELTGVDEEALADVITAPVRWPLVVAISGGAWRLCLCGLWRLVGVWRPSRLSLFRCRD